MGFFISINSSKKHADKGKNTTNFVGRVKDRSEIQALGSVSELPSLQKPNKEKGKVSSIIPKKKTVRKKSKEHQPLEPCVQSISISNVAAVAEVGPPAPSDTNPAAVQNSQSISISNVAAVAEVGPSAPSDTNPAAVQNSVNSFLLNILKVQPTVAMPSESGTHVMRTLPPSAGTLGALSRLLLNMNSRDDGPVFFESLRSIQRPSTDTLPVSVQNPAFRMLHARFQSMFLWPVLLSLVPIQTPAAVALPVSIPEQVSEEPG